MQRHVLRALLLAMVALMLGAATATAQGDTESEGRLLGNEDGSVLIGISNDVTLAAGDTANAVVIVQGSALIEGVTEGIVAIEADVTIQGPDASVEGIIAIGGSLTVTGGASVENIGYVDTDGALVKTCGNRPFRPSFDVVLIRPPSAPPPA